MNDADPAYSPSPGIGEGVSWVRTHEQIEQIIEYITDRQKHTLSKSRMETLSGRNFLFKMNPPKDGTNMKKLHKFFSQMGHITMEKADLQNNTKWFEACKEKGFLEAMDYHREGVRGVFGMENYDAWRNGEHRYYVLFDTDDMEEDHHLRSPFAPVDYHARFPVPNYLKEEEKADFITEETGWCVVSLSREEPY